MGYVLVVSNTLIDELGKVLQLEDLEEAYEEISEVFEVHCTDAYTRGYFTRKLEVDSEEIWNKKELVEETLDFAKRMRDLYNK